MENVVVSVGTGVFQIAVDGHKLMARKIGAQGWACSIDGEDLEETFDDPCGALEAGVRQVKVNQEVGFVGACLVAKKALFAEAKAKMTGFVRKISGPNQSKGMGLK